MRLRAGATIDDARRRDVAQKKEGLSHVGPNQENHTLLVTA